MELRLYFFCHCEVNHRFARSNPRRIVIARQFIAEATQKNNPSLREFACGKAKQSTNPKRIDCHENSLRSFSRNDESVDSAFKTTEGFSVWLSWFFEIFEAETRLGVCEASKISKSAECNSKDKLPHQKAQKASHPPTALLRLSLFPPPKNPLFPAFVAFTPAPLLALLKLF